MPQFSKIDGFACVSRATQTAAIDRDILAMKTVVIPNGVDHVLYSSKPDEHLQQKLRDRYGLGTEKKLLIGLGRAVSRKGYSWFVKKVLPFLGDDVVFIHCGPSSSYSSKTLHRFFPERWIQMYELMLGLPTDETELQEEAKRQPTRFIKTGYLPFAEVIQLMKMSGIFIMPNLKVENDMEGFGLVALEACIAGCEVFASATDGITDAIIDGENGRLLPAGNEAAWVHAIKMRLARGEDIETIRRFQEYTMKNYSWATMCSTYLNWFKGIIKQQEKTATFPNTSV
ncbi:MAG: glycosyltransferase family 4 protein [Saprospiraceae bacterium]|nr:glycosyltransferase family 4 protein [Saprospiraceae bacterium]